MEELLKSLNLTGRGQTEDDGCLTVELNDSNEFGKIYSKLESLDFLTADDDLSNISSQTSTIIFYNDDYLISLVGDLESDQFSLTIKPTQEK